MFNLEGRKKPQRYQEEGFILTNLRCCKDLQLISEMLNPGSNLELMLDLLISKFQLENIFENAVFTVSIVSIS